MRLIRILSLAGIMVVLALAGASVFAQEASPAGSYQQTCTDISVKKGNLYAKCQDEQGKPHATKLSHYEKCSDIANQKGNLQCTHAEGGTAAALSQAASLPAGSYTQSCKDVRMKGNTLRAVCKDHTGKDTETVLRDANRCAQGVVNLDGFLNCETDVLPPGSYMSNCKDPRIIGGTLYASCDNGKDKSISSKLPNADLCTGDIANHEGSLRCVESKPEKPAKEEKKK